MQNGVQERLLLVKTNMGGVPPAAGLRALHFFVCGAATTLFRVVFFVAMHFYAPKNIYSVPRTTSRPNGKNRKSVTDACLTELPYY